jgi:hypothetical protein
VLVSLEQITLLFFLQAGYANKTFDIFAPQTNGRLTNIQDTYCMTNSSIELQSNYSISDINGGGDAITEINKVYYFVPEKLVADGDLSASRDMMLSYIDDHGCAYTTPFTVNVDVNHNVKKNVNLTIEDKYCIVDKDFKITSDYDVFKFVWFRY